MRTGGSVSRTRTVNVFEAKPPRVFVYEHVTVVVAMANVEPDAGLHVAGPGDGSTESVYVALNVTGAPEGDVASTVMLAGTLIVGRLLPTTVTMKLFVELFPAASVAVQFTVVGPIGNAEPETGEHVNVGVVVTLSVAVTV